MHEDICTKFAAGISQKNAERIDVFCVVAAAILIDGFFKKLQELRLHTVSQRSNFFAQGVLICCHHLATPFLRYSIRLESTKRPLSMSIVVTSI